MVFKLQTIEHNDTSTEASRASHNKSLNMRLAGLLRLIGVCALALVAGPALAAGNASAGQAQAIVCSACHGQDGATPIDPTYPSLAGQNEKYLYRQLQKIRDDDRTILLMAGQLTGKSDQDLQDLAAYYASLAGKVGQAEEDDEKVQRAAMIYRGGIMKKGVAACAACHSPDGSGNAPAGYPRLTGQPVAYTVAQLTAYREEERKTDEDYGGMMRGVAAGLTDTEIRILADYVNGLH